MEHASTARAPRTRTSVTLRPQREVFKASDPDGSRSRDSRSAQPARLELALLDPQVAHELGVVAAQKGGETVRAEADTLSVETHVAVGATRDAVHQTLNWPLIVCLLACLLFWGVVVVGIVAVV